LVARVEIVRQLRGYNERAMLAVHPVHSRADVG
jgi:hypothetical protein